MVYLYTDAETRSLIGFLDREEPSGIDSHHRVCAHADGGEVGWRDFVLTVKAGLLLPASESAGEEALRWPGCVLQL